MSGLRVGVVRPAPEGTGRMITSIPERSEVFDVIIRPAPEGAGRTTHEQTAKSRYFHGNLCHIALTERGVAAILLLEIYWALSLPPFFLDHCKRTWMVSSKGHIHAFKSICNTQLVFGPNELPWMTFGLECQLCPPRGASEAMTSQWSNLRGPFNNRRLCQQLPIVPSETSQWSVEAWQHCTHVYRSQRQQRGMKFWFFDTDIL